MRSIIVKRPNRANGWSPQGFNAYVEHYPDTVWPPVAPEDDLTASFTAHWTSDTPLKPAAIRTVVLTPGLFSEFLPGCFAAAKATLGAAGFQVIRTRARSRYGVRQQAARIARELRDSLEPGESFVWCGHSKGAIELLYALHATPALGQTCAAAVVVQPAVGVSPVVDRWQNRPQNVLERFGGALMTSPPVRAGVRDISARRDPAVSDWLARFVPVVPTVCAVTWSIQPTSWVDSYHRTLNQIAPGHAHDGQFLMADQRIAGASLIGLPQLDHAQPVFGGHGFDAQRFWRALVRVALDVAAPSGAPAAQTR